MSTFSELANSGIQSLAVYEPGKPIDEVARELGFESASELIKLASNENELGPSPMAMDAMRDAVTGVHRYPDGGAFYLRQALATHLKVDADQVLPGNGSNELLELIAHVFLEPGTSVVMAEQAFVVYRLIAAAAGADVKSVPMRDFHHDLPAMLDAIDPGTRVVFVANPNNPTGTVVTPQAVEAFMSSVPAHVVVCFDEAYIELIEEGMRPDVLRYVREGRNVIVLRTFSKAYGLAGLRVGYGIAPAEAISLLNRVRQPFNVNSMALAAAEAALGDDDFLKRTRHLVRVGLADLERGCRRLGLEPVPAVANFILVKVGAGRRVFEELQRLGVIVRPMDGYGLPEYVRVTVGTPEQNQRFLRAVSHVLGIDDSSLEQDVRHEG